MKTSTIIGLVLLAIVLSSTGSFGVGWHLRGVSYTVKQNKQLKVDIDQYNRSIDNILATSEAARAKIDGMNQQTAAESAEVAGKIGELNDRLQAVQSNLSKLSTIGVCRFTPDADGLYEHTYEATIGVAADAKAPGRD